MNNQLLKIEGLKKYFPVKRGLFYKTVGEVKAVDGVSFTINRGETFGLVGESGCGKTTVGRLILRILEPDSGRIFYGNEDLTEVSPSRLRQLRRHLQIVFQDPFGSLDPRFTIGRSIGEGLSVFSQKGISAYQYLGGRNKREIRERVGELLELVGLPRESLSKYPHEFSGGQRQRIAIARALALNPDFIVCDEPVSSLDVSVGAQIINLLSDLQDRLNLSYLFIAHNLSVIEHVSDRIAVMYLGRFVEVASAEELYARPLHPYTKLLFSSIPRLRRGPERKKETVLKGDVPSALNPPSGCAFHPRCPFANEVCTQVRPELVEKRKSRFVACHKVESFF